MERRVLITGCSSGIGRATAHAFLSEDWEVMATARNPDELHELRKLGARTRALDVTDDEQISAVVKDTAGAAGIDCLVNNAGFAQAGALEDISPSRLHRQFDVNVIGVHRLTRAVLPYMREQGDGTIINLSSGVGQISMPGFGAYSASKFALEAMSDALRAEVAGDGIDVVVVQPGLVSTNFYSRMNQELAELRRSDSYADLYRLLDDWGSIDGGIATRTPEDVAEVIVHAASGTSPAVRYPVGPLARLAALAGMSPPGLRARVIRLGYRIAARVTR